MKTLLLMRHGTSPNIIGARPDHDRPLAQRGVNDVINMGKQLLAKGVKADTLLSSTAIRARHTAELVAEHAKFTAPIEFRRDLYHADASTYRSIINMCDDAAAAVMLFGHNPGVSDLVYSLTGEMVDFPPAAIAQIRCNINSWSELSDGGENQLLAFLTP